MALLKTVLVSIGVSSALWLAVTVLPSVIRVCFGTATGIGFAVPRALQGFPKPLQVLLALLGVPLLVGIVVGCLWFFLTAL